MKMQAFNTDRTPLPSIEMLLICLAGIAVGMGWIAP